MRTIILIDRNGKEVHRAPAPSFDPPYCSPWVHHGGKWYGFGVGKTSGELFFYEQTPKPGYAHEAHCTAV